MRGEDGVVTAGVISSHKRPTGATASTENSSCDRSATSAERA